KIGFLRRTEYDFFDLVSGHLRQQKRPAIDLLRQPVEERAIADEFGSHGDDNRDSTLRVSRCFEQELNEESSAILFFMRSGLALVSKKLFELIDNDEDALLFLQRSLMSETSQAIAVQQKRTGGRSSRFGGDLRFDFTHGIRQRMQRVSSRPHI